MGLLIGRKEGADIKYVTVKVFRGMLLFNKSCLCRSESLCTLDLIVVDILYMFLPLTLFSRKIFLPFPCLGSSKL